MLELYKIKRAVRFATKTHEVYQKQKRKGKDIAYITHPLTVGLILSQVGASIDCVCAGILHDTIEDCVPERKVTKKMLTERFGRAVAKMVWDVTERDKSLSWEERKKVALEHIRTYSRDSLLVKSADLVSNLSELVEDYDQDGDRAFLRFNAPKERKIKNSLQIIATIIGCWPENPLAHELRYLADKIRQMDAVQLMRNDPAAIVEYEDYVDTEILTCPVCGWRGMAKDGNVQYGDVLLDVSCLVCDKMLLVVNYPIVKQDCA